LKEIKEQVKIYKQYKSSAFSFIVLD